MAAFDYQQTPDDVRNLEEEQNDRSSLLHLHRLLYAMEHYNPPNASADALLARVTVAQSLWEQVSRRIDMPETSPVYREWEGRLERACRHAQNHASEERAKAASDEANQDDPIHRIFFSPRKNQESSPSSGNSDTEESSSEDDGNDLEFSDSESDENDEETAANENRNTQQSNLADLQKTQREQVEQAISQMALQLKTQTSRIHATLQSQAQNLDVMEDVATDNVAQVTDVAQQVQKEVQQGWTQTIGTWTMVFTIIGAFCFGLMTIQMAPKRPGACIFFCDYSSGTKQQQQEAAPRDEYCRMIDGSMECLNVEDIYNSAKATVDMLENDENEVDATDDNNIEADGSDSTDSKVYEYSDEIENDVFDKEDGFLEDGDETFDDRKEEETYVDEEEIDDEHDDDFTLPPAEQMRGEALRDLEEYSREASHMNGMAAECEMDMNGECTETANEIKDGFEVFEEEAEKDIGDLNQNTRTSPPVMEADSPPPKRKEGFANPDPFSGAKVAQEANAIPEAILCNGRPFGSRDVRRAAGDGDFESLQCYLNGRPEFANSVDKNGWSVVHLAARAGREDILSLTIKANADLTKPTVAGKTALDIAKDNLTIDHPVVRLLVESVEKSTPEAENGDSTSEDMIVQALESTDEREVYHSVVEPMVIPSDTSDGKGGGSPPKDAQRQVNEVTEVDRLPKTASDHNISVDVDVDETPPEGVQREIKEDTEDDMLSKTGSDHDKGVDDAHSGHETSSSMHRAKVDSLVEAHEEDPNQREYAEQHEARQEDAEHDELGQKETRDIDAHQEEATTNSIEDTHASLNHTEMNQIDEGIKHDADATATHAETETTSSEDQTNVNPPQQNDANAQDTSHTVDNATEEAPDEMAADDTATNTERPISKQDSDNATVDETDQDTKNASETQGHTSAASEPPAEIICGIPVMALTLREVHAAANHGNLESLACYVREHPEYLNAQDENGWAIVHTAARKGYIDILEMLYDEDADLFLQAVDGRTPFDIARESLSPDHEIIEFFMDLEEDDDEEEEE